MKRTFTRQKVGVVSFIVVVALVIAAVFANRLAPMDPNAQDYAAVLQAPSTSHLLGTDEFGRDILSRILFGARVSLVVGFASVLCALVLGTTLGTLAGYIGGLFDEVVMRTMDAIYSFPAIILALALTAVLGPGIRNLIVALGIVYTPIFARLSRGTVLSTSTRAYVVAARALGASSGRVMVRHISPSSIAPIIVQASLSVSFAIITEASLSFLGVGVQPPTASWGAMLRSGYGYMEMAPWYAVFPGAAIFVAVLALNLVGDSLRDLLDPKLKSR